MSVITDRKAFDKAAIPLLATDRAKLPKLLASLAPAERRWAEAAGFDGAPNTHHAVIDAKGKLVRVLVGVRDADDPWALAALPLKLPAGRYVVEAVEDEAPALSPDEEAGIEAALQSYRQGRVVDAKRAREIIDAALGR